MSQCKYSNHLVELVVEKATVAQRAALIEEVCSGSQPCPLVTMVKDKYAHFAVQVEILHWPYFW